MSLNSTFIFPFVLLALVIVSLGYGTSTLQTKPDVRVSKSSVDRTRRQSCYNPRIRCDKGPCYVSCSTLARVGHVNLYGYGSQEGISVNGIGRPFIEFLRIFGNSIKKNKKKRR